MSNDGRSFINADAVAEGAAPLLTACITFAMQFLSTLDHHDFAIAFNSLAQVLADQKHYAEAIAAAHQAINLGGLQQKVALDTLKQIEQKKTK